MGWKDMVDAMRQVIPFPGARVPRPVDPARALLDAFYAGDGNLAGPEAAPLLEASPELRASALVLAFEDTASTDYRLAYLGQSIGLRLARARLPLTDDHLVRLASVWATTNRELPAGNVVGAIERRAAEGALPAPLVDAIQRWVTRLEESGYHEERKVELRLRALVMPETPGAAASPFSVEDPWGQRMHRWFTGLGPERPAWEAILAHAALSSGKARPTPRWETQARPLLDALGEERFTTALVGWLPDVDLTWQRRSGWDPAYGPVDPNADLLKGLIWFAVLVPDEALAASLADFGERAFKKIKGYGAASTKLGNAVLAVLGAMPDGAGVAQLTRLGNRVRYASARRLVERALDAASERSGQSREDIEEIAIPTFGLDADGVKRVPLAGFEAELRLSDGIATLAWRKSDGKPQKSVPKAVKDAEPAALKALKADLKNLGALAATQARRIEQHWLRGRVLPVKALADRYLAHPVVGQVARRLLWWLEPASGEPFAALWHDGALADIGGNPVNVPDDTPARLWHPLLGDAERQLVWRDRLDELGIEQPFGQLWREVYRASDEPGAAVSTRYAGVLLDQRRLYDHAQKRGWRYQIQGHWDSWNAPTLVLPELEVELEAEPVPHSGDDYVFAYVVSGQVRFQGRDGRPLRLADVDPLALSEVLREVDGLVAASSAGARAPTTGFPRGFDWEDLAFGPLSPLGRTRRDVLARVLPRTTLRDACALDDPWLVVQGPKGPARIHLGSGQVQVQGSTHALVPGKKAVEAAKKAFLPFEGDAALPAILALAHAWHLGD